MSKFFENNEDTHRDRRVKKIKSDDGDIGAGVVDNSQLMILLPLGSGAAPLPEL